MISSYSQDARELFLKGTSLALPPPVSFIVMVHNMSLSYEIKSWRSIDVSLIPRLLLVNKSTLCWLYLYSRQYFFIFLTFVSFWVHFIFPLRCRPPVDTYNLLVCILFCSDISIGIPCSLHPNVAISTVLLNRFYAEYCSRVLSLNTFVSKVCGKECLRAAVPEFERSSELVSRIM